MDCFTKEQVRRAQAVHRREKKVEFREDYFDAMPGVGIDKQIEQLLGKSSGIDSEDVIEEWKTSADRGRFSALMLSHSMEKEHLLDEFRSSPIWWRFVRYANRPVAENRSTETKWRPLTLFRIQTSKAIAGFATVVGGLPLLFL
jgi:hypothetical protein